MVLDGGAACIDAGIDNCGFGPKERLVILRPGCITKDMRGSGVEQLE